MLDLVYPSRKLHSFNSTVSSLLLHLQCPALHASLEETLDP